VIDHPRPRDGGAGSFVYRRLAEEVARASRYPIPLSCLVFRVVEAGRPRGLGGERLAWAATELARRIVRHSDVVGLLGGGQFAVVANTGDTGARKLAQSIAAQIQSLDFVRDGQSVRVAIGYGIACLDHGKTPRELLDEAKAALELQLAAHGVEGHC